MFGISAKWTKKNSNKKIQEQQGPRSSTKYHGGREGTPGDTKQEQEVVQGPGPASGSGRQRLKIYEQQDTLQSYGSRFQNKRKAGQGEEAELPIATQCGYGTPCDHRYQGLPCRWQGQPATTGYSAKITKKIMATGPSVRELRCRYRIQ